MVRLQRGALRRWRDRTGCRLTPLAGCWPQASRRDLLRAQRWGSVGASRCWRSRVAAHNRQSGSLSGAAATTVYGAGAAPVYGDGPSVAERSQHRPDGHGLCGGQGAAAFTSHAAWISDQRAEPQQQLTPYVRWGERPLWLLLMATVIVRVKQRAVGSGRPPTPAPRRKTRPPGPE